MTTTLTAPIARTETVATVDGWELRLSRNANFSINLADSRFDVNITMRLADGSQSSQRLVQFPLAQLSPGTLTVLRNFHAQVVGYARGQGALPAGVDTADI